VKKIEAYIRHEALEAIHDRLEAIGLPSMSVTEVKGSGRQKGFTETYRGARSTIFLRPKVKLEIGLDDSDLERALDVILEVAHTGNPGDGKIFVYDIAEAIRVRTGERGPVVLAPHVEDVAPKEF
jgi:nitrogen regulatory protein PII